MPGLVGDGASQREKKEERKEGEKKRRERRRERKRRKSGEERVERERKKKKNLGGVSGFEIQIYSVFNFLKEVSFFSILKQNFDF